MHHEELWEPIGRKDETYMVTDIVAVPVEQARIVEPTPFQESIFYSRDNLSSGRELWKLPNDATRPQLVRYIALPRR